MAIETTEAVGTAQKARYLRIKVVDTTRSDRPAVNVRMPMGLVKWGMKAAQAFSPELKRTDVDWDSLTAAVTTGELGKIVEVEDEAEHKTVEVWVE